jgi:hypothetical protein
MSSESFLRSRAAGSRYAKQRSRARARKSLRNHSVRMEHLEARNLLSVTGPQLATISPYETDFIGSAPSPNQLIYPVYQSGATNVVLNVAPRELVLTFNQGESIDATTLGGIQVTRSGGDNLFGGTTPALDAAVPIGWVGLGPLNSGASNEVIVRFAQDLPNDLYMIHIVGSGAAPLKDTSGLPFNSGQDQNVYFDLQLGAHVTSVVPQPIVRNVDGSLNPIRNQINVYFDARMDASSAQNPSFYQLIVTNNTGNTSDDYIVPSSEINSIIYGYKLNLNASASGSSVAVSLLNGSFNAGTSPITRVGASLQAVAGSAITNGQWFSITDNSGNTTKFEFDLDPTTVTPGRFAIQYTAADSASIVAQSIATAISSPAVSESILSFKQDLAAYDAALVNGTRTENSSYRLRIGTEYHPFTTDTRVGYTSFLSTFSEADTNTLGTFNPFNPGTSPITLTNSSLQAVTGGGLSNGQWFSLTDYSGGLTEFEFDLDPTLATGGRLAIKYSAADTAATVAQSIATAIGASGLNIKATVTGSKIALTRLNGSTGSALADPLGGQTWVINGAITAQPYGLEWPGGRDTPGNRSLPDQVDISGESHFDAGSLAADLASANRGARSIQAPDPSRGQIKNGDWFALTDQTGTRVEFEFTDGTIVATGGRTPITFTATDTSETVAINIALAIQNSGLRITPAVTGGTIALAGVVGLVNPQNLPAVATDPGNSQVRLLDIPTFFYNFKDNYDPNNPNEHNSITAAQEELAREIFQLYGAYLGVKFVESADQGLTVATGNLDALGGTSGPGGVIGMAGGSLAVMDAAEDWGVSVYGGGWFSTAMHEIGHLLGYGHNDEAPELSVMNVALDPTVNLTTPENILPGALDIATGQYLYQTNSNGIDLYRFNLPSSGTVSLETLAQRLQNSSLLNTNLILFNSSHQVVARNDDYFGTDSYIHLQLAAGTYYIGVSSSGNDQYNPNVADSGSGGNSDGAYQLRIGFQPDNSTAMVSANGVALDGENDGVPGGFYNYWFSEQTATNTLYVDKAENLLVVPSDVSKLADGQTFTVSDGVHNVVFELDTSVSGTQVGAGHQPVAIRGATTPLGIATAVTTAVKKAFTQGLLNVSAATVGSSSTGYQVELLGDRAAFNALQSGFAVDGAQYSVVEVVSFNASTLNHETFSIGDGANTLVFEFDTAAAVSSVNALGHQVVPLSGVTTATGAASSIALAINAAQAVKPSLLNVTATASGVLVALSSGAVFLPLGSVVALSGPGSSRHPFGTISAALAAVQSGQILRVMGNNSANDNNGNTIIVPVNAAQIIAGQTSFTISDGGQTVNFLFNKAGTVTAGSVLVPFQTTDTAQTLAAEIAAAINGASIVNSGAASVGLRATAAVAQDANGLWQVILSGSSVALNVGASNAATPLRNTLQDNVPYEIGTDLLGHTLADGAKMDVPKGVTVTFEAGAVAKLLKANISVGSVAENIDHSLGAVQVLGSPTSSVYFTSYNNEEIGTDTFGTTTTPASGDWGGLVFRNDYDYDEQVADPTRRILEQEGIFLDYVNHATISYGGGQVNVNGVQDYYDPIYASAARPTVMYSSITFSGHAAISADPKSFQESLFHDRFGETLYTADYSRTGPLVYGNLIVNNTYNGLFVRVSTAAGGSQQALDVSADFSNIDIPYVMAETLTIQGNPGGPLATTGTTQLTPLLNNQIQVPMDPDTLTSTIVDREYFVLSDRYHTVRFEFDTLGDGVQTGSVQIVAGITTPGITLLLPAATVAQNLVDAINSQTRSTSNPNGLNISATVLPGGKIQLSGNIVVVEGLTQWTGRPSGRLNIAPGVVVKLSAARIETGISAQLLAEGTIDHPIVFTSLQDDSYGGSGTFDTSSNGSAHIAAAGDWSGLYFWPDSTASMDYARVMYAGGTSAIEGGFANFAPVEIRQAEVRITNSVFQNNRATATSDDRNGRGDLPAATVIQIRGAQPVLVNNVLLNNTAIAMSTDPNSLTSFQVQDWGRSTAMHSYLTPYLNNPEIYAQYANNVGPMIRGNKLWKNTLNGLLVREGTMTTEGVWDDTDIVHIVEGEIVVPNQTVYGGLRLQSDSSQSLVVKLLGTTAGFLATGTPVEITDRIGGALQVVGIPGHPVVLTSLNDSTVGAGFDPWGNPLFLTNNNTNVSPKAGDWDSVILDQYSNDTNVDVINEYELPYGSTSDLNGTPGTAQALGSLAQSTTGGDDTLRLGFEVHGNIASDNAGDVDVYSFTGFAGSQVWMNVERTTYALDSVLELLDANGTVLARSDNATNAATGAEIAPEFVASGQLATTIGTDSWGNGDLYSTNPKDPAMRVVLPGPAGTQRTYYVRISSKNGLSSGQYRLQIRLQQGHVAPGSVVRYADIRYATNGVTVLGLPDKSPLQVNYFDLVTGPGTTTPNSNIAQPIGNLLASDTGSLSVAGYLNNYQDVDWYAFIVDYNTQTGGSTVEIPSASMYPVVFDINYASGLARPDTQLWLFDSTGTLLLKGSASNITDNTIGPLQGANSASLTTGSYSTGDAYIGPVYLPTNTNVYYVAVTTLGATANATRQPLLRYEPVDSVARVAEDNIGMQNASLINQPPTNVLFPGDTPAQVNQAATPFNLGDVPLYVLTSDQLYTADAYTGAPETQVSEPIPALPYTNPNSYNNGSLPYVTYGDIVMRNDGRLYAVTAGPQQGAPPAANGVNQSLWSGTYVQLDTGDASNQPVTTQPDGIKTYYQTNPTTIEEAGDDKYEQGGLQVNATVFGPGILNRSLYAVGTSLGGGPSAGAAPYGLNNLLYLLDENGNATNPTGIVNDNSSRLPTNFIPLAQLHTGSTIVSPSYGATALNKTGPAADVIGVGNDILDGTNFTITDSSTPSKTVTFEFDSGPDLDLGLQDALGVRDGQQFRLSDGTTTKTFEFDSGPVLIFTNDLAGTASLDGKTFNVTDDKGVNKVFEFITQPAKTPPTVLIQGAVEVDIPAGASAQQVGQAAVTAINAAGFDAKAALGDISNQANPNLSVWARVSLIKDSIDPNLKPSGLAMNVEGSYGRTVSSSNTILIPYKETYYDPTFVAIETAAPAVPPLPADVAQGYPWPVQFGQQIQAIVQQNMPTLRVGFSPRSGQGYARINFYGAVNTTAGQANFGQATALIHDPATANADFRITSVNVGAKYNGVQVVITSSGAVTGNNAKITFTPGATVGGTLTIDINAGNTTTLTVVNAINAYAAANPNTPSFTAWLDTSQEVGGQNTGAGLVKVNASAATTGGGFDNGIMTWTDTTGFTNQVENQFSTWGATWAWRYGANNTGGPDAPLSGTGLQFQSANRESIVFSAGDSAVTIATEISAGIKKAAIDFPGFATLATVDGAQVDLTNVSGTTLPVAQQPISTVGEGPGGTITGITIHNGVMYAVSDLGGVFEITNYNSPEFKTLPDLGGVNQPPYSPNDIQLTGAGPIVKYLGTIKTDSANPVDVAFEGLTIGPANVENGAYADTLFAISRDGTLYALTTDNVTAEKSPIFLDGATSIRTNLGNNDVRGLVFTTLDYNLWHVTNQRGTDAGHTINPTYDLVRPTPSFPIAGGASFYFGLEDPTAATTISNQPGAMNYYFTNPAVYNTYNLPGGAAGSLVTQPFSLADYTAGDAPTLYFDYNFTNGGPTDNPHDTARVFASADEATWVGLADLAGTNGTWSQGVYSLASFAGQKTVYLRFDFSTAGDMGVGDGGFNAVLDPVFDTALSEASNMYSGSYLAGLSGEQVNDGDVFTIDNQNFEFDMGVALSLPAVAGDVLQDGETFTIRSGTAGNQTDLQTFVFKKNGGTGGAGQIVIPFAAGETTAQLTQAIANAVNQANLKNSLGTTIVADAYENRVMLNGAEAVTKSANATTSVQALQAYAASTGQVANGQIFTLTDSNNKSVKFRFNSTGATVPAGTVSVAFQLTDTAAQIAVDLATAINKAHLAPYGLGVTATADNGVVTLYGLQVTLTQDALNPSLITLLSNGSGATGDATTNFAVPISSTDTAAEVAAAIANAMEGAFGTMLQLRATAGNNITTASTFTITNQTGVISTFELTTTGTVTAGNIEIDYKTTDTAVTVAAAIATAINNANLGYTASTTQTTTGTGTTVTILGTGLRFSPLTSGITQIVGSASKVNGKVVNVIGHTVAQNGILPFSNILPGDHPLLPTLNYDRYQGTGFDPTGLSRERGQDNAHEGIYIDNLVVGFTERGQMVTDATPDITFTFVQPLGIVTQGYYQLQVRKAADYGQVSLGGGYPVLGQMVLTRTFDTNDRLSNSISWQVPPSWDIPQGMTFTVSDGVHDVAFQFLGQAVTYASDPNYRPIYFAGSQTSAQMALLVAAAINLATSKGLLNVQAVANGTSDRVDLEGAIRVSSMSAGTATLTVFSQIQDGQTFRLIDNQGRAVTFQFTSTGANTSPNIPVNYSKTDTIAEINADIAAAINSANTAPYNAAPYNSKGLLNITATATTTLITLSGPMIAFEPGSSELTMSSYSTDITAPAGGDIPYGLGVSIVGTDPTTLQPLVENFQFLVFPGAPTGTATPVYYTPTDSAATVAQALITAINGLTGTFGVTAAVGSVDGHIILTGALRVLGLQTSDTSIRFNDEGDQVQVEPQGETIIQSNKITNSLQYGIVSSSLPQDFLYPVGSNAPLRVVDAQRLVPGTVIENNVVAYSGTGGIYFAGNANITGLPNEAVVPFGRIINNTVYGSATPVTGTVGIIVGNNASPTILNNIVAGWDTGIGVVAPAGDLSGTTVVGYSVYQNNTTNTIGVTTDTGSIIAQASAQLWVNPDSGNFYPAAQSPEEDSSINQLDDRPAIVSSRQPLGIPSSPILAPNYDMLGQLRIDDPSVANYPGLGSNVYKDRGAIDRVDFIGPTASLSTPLDNGPSDLDATDYQALVSAPLTVISIQLSDSGSGVDPGTVVTGNVVLTRTNAQGTTTLVDGTDYFFTYDSTNHVINLIPATAIYAPNYTYTITLSQSIADMAANPLQANHLGGTTYFAIHSVSGLDYSHAPNYAVAWNIIDPGIYLGLIPPVPQQFFSPAAADSDDDGVSFAGVSLIASETGSLTVNVHNTTGKQAYLTAWIDFDQNGAFDVNDYIADAVTVSPGANTITFPIPADAMGGGTWARFRVTTSPVPLAPDGGAIDGEVEDYGPTGANAVTILPPPATVAGHVYNDVNSNGQLDAGEPGLAGWTVSIDSVPAVSTTTAADGSYSLSVATPGSYHVTETPPGGFPPGAWVSTVPATGSYSITTTAGGVYTSEDFGNHYTLHPAVTSIVKLDADPTNAATVHYSVTFVQPVTGVLASSLIVSATNFPSPTIATPTPTGAPVTIGNVSYYVSWNVAVATGAGTLGTFELKMNDTAQSIHDASGNSLSNPTFVQPNQGAVYHIDHVQPSVVSIVATDPLTQGATNAQFLHFAVTFSKGVIGLNKYNPNFALVLATSSGVTNAEIASVAVASSDYTKYTVTVFTGIGSGTLGLNLADPQQTIQDAVGNTLTGSGSGSTVFVGPTYAIDRVLPAATISLATGQSSLTSVSPINFKVVFSKPVTGFTSAGVSLSLSTIPNLQATVTGSGTTYNMAVTGMTGSGAVVASVMVNAAQDYLGNQSIASGNATVNFTSTPTVTVGQAVTQANPVNSGPIHFTVTFNQAVVDFNATKLNFNGSTTPGTLAGSVTGSGPVYDVAVSGMSGSGRVQLSIAANTVHNSTGTGNAASTGTTNYVYYVIDAPSELLSNPAAGTSVADTVMNPQGYIDVIYSAQVGIGVNTATITDADPEFTLSGTAAAGVTVNGAATTMGGDVFRYTFTGSFGVGAVSVNFVASAFQDNAGNFNKAASYNFNVLRAISVNNVAVTRPATGSVNAVFTVSLSGANSLPVTVQYATANGTNTAAGVDYMAQSGLLTFKIGETSKTVSVPVLASSSTDTPKTFLLNLSSPSNATITQASGTCTITTSKGAGVIANLLSLSPTTGSVPTLPGNLAAAVAAARMSSSVNTDKKHATSAVDAVFATMMTE